MRWRAESGVLAATGLLVSCAFSLEDEPQRTLAGQAQQAPAPSCELWGELPLDGPGRAIAMQGGPPMWVFGGKADGDRTEGVVVEYKSPVDTTSNPCAHADLAVRPALPATASDTDFATPLDVVVAGSEMFLFFEAWRLDATQAFGVRVIGRGVARWDPKPRQFRRLGLLWTADRPNYGISAWFDGERVYAYGCANSGPLQRDCYAARVPVHAIANPTAWQYAVGVDSFSANADAAVPILVGVGDLSVRKGSDGRMTVSYVPVLGDRVMVRTALGPTGPFSAAHEWFRCELAAGEFCTGGVRQVAAEGLAGLAVASYTRASFAPMAAGRAQVRLVQLALPSGLP